MLFQHGRDFDAIHAYFEKKNRERKGDPTQVKTKDQIRFLYYRSWQKISKYVENEEGIEQNHCSYEFLNGLMFENRNPGPFDKCQMYNVALL